MPDTFPVEPYHNQKVLEAGIEKFKLYIGTNKWGRTEWIGKLYPEGTKEADFLDYYVNHFNAIELHATHYTTYPTDTIKKWANKADGKDFLFCPKFPQSISHYSGFVNIEDKTNDFIESIRVFKEHLGPAFLQVSQKFSSKKSKTLFNYLQGLPGDLEFFLEVRNPDWFEGDAQQQLLDFLREQKIGLIIQDDSQRPFHIDLTIPKCFIRYSRLGDQERLLKWADKLREWKTRGLEQAYFFIGSEENAEQALVMEELLYFKSLVSDLL